jgi:hypothetical protein
MSAILSRRALVAGSLIAVATPAAAVRFETLDAPTVAAVARQCADEAAFHRALRDALAIEDGTSSISCPRCGCQLFAEIRAGDPVDVR